MRKLLPPLLLLLLLLLLPLFALAEPAWTEVPELIRPGKSVRLTAEADGVFDASVLSGDGSVAVVLAQGASPQEGIARLYWDGLDASGEPLPEGSYTLRLTCGGETAEAALRVGPPAPMILSLMADDSCSGDWTATVEASMPGTLTVSLRTPEGKDETLISQRCEAGETILSWDGFANNKAVSGGEWELTIRLLDETGYSSNPETVDVTVAWPSLATDVTYHTPGEDSPIPCDHDVCYWKMNMGEMDEAAIWEVLTQPVTVLRGGQRELVKVRS